ncbi:MAG TPA: hypothetical protein VGI74_01270 [Streptosporangiaceae bacterium]|jgi:hypothetical protein
MRTVGDKLTAHGFRIRQQDEEGQSVAIIGQRDIRCELTVTDSGYVQWECSRRDDGEIDPKKLADLATILLTDREGTFPQAGDGYSVAGITLKGIVGRELKARGLDVAVEVYADESFYGSAAEIVAANPETGEDATVCITDDGSVVWQWDCWLEAATITNHPVFSWRLTNPGELASTIANKIARAMTQAMPELAPA